VPRDTVIANAFLPPVQNFLTVSGIGLTGSDINVGLFMYRMLENGQLNLLYGNNKNAYPDLFINSPLFLILIFMFINTH